jgi:hypothetical protein
VRLLFSKSKVSCDRQNHSGHKFLMILSIRSTFTPPLRRKTISPDLSPSSSKNPFFRETIYLPKMPTSPPTSLPGSPSPPSAMPTTPTSKLISQKTTRHHARNTSSLRFRK